MWSHFWVPCCNSPETALLVTSGSTRLADWEMSNPVCIWLYMKPITIDLFSLVHLFVTPLQSKYSACSTYYRRITFINRETDCIIPFKLPNLNQIMQSNVDFINGKISLSIPMREVIVNLEKKVDIWMIC